MPGTTLGNAYVQIIPSAKGIKGNIEKELGGEAQAAGTSVGSKLASFAKTAILAAGIGKVFSAAIKEGAALQQSLGGIETLFKDSADKMKGYASQAFKTAGLSANEYMETATTFAASLVNSLGGNTAQAADIANMAIIDMSDNANKMGTDMQSIQDAYKGFAKQNYTMLDNLNLGYGGTREQMQKLLADAEKLTGIKYDINNLSDVYSAINAIQRSMGISGYTAEELREKIKSASLTTEELGKVAESMGITSEEAFKRMKNGTLSVKDANVLLGTTAREAQTTVSGSYKMMQASAKDFLGALAGEGTTSVEDALNNMVESAMTFAGNLLPMIEKVLTGIIQALPSIITRLFDALFTVIIPGLANLVMQLIPAILNALQQLTQMLIDFANDPSAVESALQFILNFAMGIIQAIPQVLIAIGQLVFALLEALISLAGELIQTGWDWMKNLASGIWNGITTNLAQVWEQMRTAIGDWLTGIWNNITERFEAIKTTFSNDWNACKDIIMSVWENIKSAVKTAIDTVKTTISNVWESIKTTTSNVWEGIKNAIKKPMEAARDFVKGIIDKIKGFFSFSISWPHIPMPHFGISPSGWKIGDLLKGSIPRLSIDWYAKGGIFNNPSVIGVGEAGPEAVVPLNRFWKCIDDMIRAIRSMNQNGDRVIDMNLTVNMDGKPVARAVERYIAREQRAATRAKGGLAFG